MSCFVRKRSRHGKLTISDSPAEATTVTDVSQPSKSVTRATSCNSGLHVNREVEQRQPRTGTGGGSTSAVIRPLKRTYAVAGKFLEDHSIGQTLTCLPDLADFDDSRARVIQVPKETKWNKFDKIGRMRSPGLSEAEFLGLFAKCDICQAITTRDVFRYHLEVCEGDSRDVVSAEDTDLGSEEEDCDHAAD